MNTLTLALKYVAIDLIGGIIRFPFWWYSKGIVLIGRWGVRTISNYVRSISLKVWMKNLFVPMFGMNDWQSRIISFFMRLFQIFARSLGVLIWSFLVIFVMSLYVLAPVGAALMALNHLSSLL